jgi:hypothetical protein
MLTITTVGGGFFGRHGQVRQISLFTVVPVR